MPASRFSKVYIPRANGNRLQGDVLTALAGLDMTSPIDEVAPGRTPEAQDFRLYQKSEGGRSVAVSTRKGPGYYTQILNESLMTANTSSTGASTAQVGVDTQMKAQPFTASVTQRLTRFDVKAANGTATSVLRVDIYDDNDGKPGSLLTQSSYIGLPDTADWVQARFVNAPLLTNGQQYWAVFYLQDDGAGFASLVTSSDGTDSFTSNSGVIGLQTTSYALLYRIYTAPTANVLGSYRFNRDDAVNRTLVVYGTTLYYIDDATGSLLPVVTALNNNATEYSFTNGDGRVFIANGYDNLIAWNGNHESTAANLVTNGGFEVNTTGWSNTGGGTGNTIARFNGIAHTGAYMLSVTATSGVRNARLTINLTKNKMYKITTWVLNGGTPGNFYINNVPNTLITTSGAWQKVEVYYFPTTDLTTLDFRSDNQNFYIDDVTIVDTGVEAIIDPELPILREIAFHKDRLWGVPAAEKNALVFSENPGNPSDQPANAQWYRAWLSVSKIYVPRPYNGSPITSLTSFQDNLVITTQDGKYVLSGTDRGNLFLRESTGFKGALSRKGVIADKNYIYFVSNDGIYRWNGSKDDKMSILIQPLFDDCPRKHEISLALWQNDVRVYMASRFSTLNDVMALFSQDFNEWMFDTNVYADRALYYSDADDDMQLVEFSSQVGAAYYAEVDFNSLGAPIDFDYRLKYDSRGLPGQKKKYKKYVPLVQAVGRTFPITYGNDKNFEGTPREKQQVLNVGGAKIGHFKIGDGTKLTGATAFTPKKTSISGYSYYMQFRVRRKAVNNQVAFMGVQFTYKAKRL